MKMIKNPKVATMETLNETVSVSEEDSDLELELEERREAMEVPVQCTEFVAKSGMKWSSKPRTSTKRLQRNIVNAKPGVTPYSQGLDLMKDIFDLFITPEIKNIICLYTNQEAERYFESWNEKNPSRPKKWKLLDHIELNCFLGILINGGALRCRREYVKELWTTDSDIRRSFFLAAISRDWFQGNSVFLRYDDKLTRADRKKGDKLATISDVWNMFVKNCTKSFEPYENLTVDEQLVAFRGRCPFRQYIKSKPAKYDIKVWAIAYVKTSYLCDLQVYTDKLPGAPREQNQGYRVVTDLAIPYYNTGRGITTDNFFTSVSLANFLLIKNLTLLGTIRKNKLETSIELKLASRPEQSSRFAFTKDLTIVSYIPKKNKIVHLLSSQHLDNSISRQNNEKQIMVLDYNDTKGGVDNADKLIREYACCRRTARWPFRLFRNMIDISTLNSFVIYLDKHPEWKKQCSSRRRLFLLKLGDALARRNMDIRAGDKTLHAHIKAALNDCHIELSGPSHLKNVAGATSA